jgi:hypothetical protein
LLRRFPFVCAGNIRKIERGISLPFDVNATRRDRTTASRPGSFPATLLGGVSCQFMLIAPVA